MRNAVIRKKRLKAERAIDDFMRMPQRIMAPAIDISHVDQEAMEQALMANRLWAFHS
jgi:hypothetical protein